MWVVFRSALLSLFLFPATLFAQERVYCDQYFYGIVTDDTVGLFIETVLQAECEAGAQLRVYVSSGGGDPQAAMGLYDWLQIRDAETVAMGNVASAAVPIFLAGRVRTALPHARFLVHPGHTTLEGTYSDRDLEEFKRLDEWDDDMYNRIIAERTGLPLEEVTQMVDPFTVFGAEQARTWGFVTK